MRKPPNERSPAAGQRDRASIIITGKLDNPLYTTPAAGFQPLRTTGDPAAVAWPRFGRARIQPLVAGTYRPADAGQWAVILGVQDRFNEIVDCVAWLPGDPSRWWLRHGDETPILGARSLAFAADCHESVTLLPTPEAWLFAHSKPKSRAVVCVLDWGVDLGPLFDGVSHVECDSVGLRDQMQRALRSWEPKITGRRTRHAA